MTDPHAEIRTPRDIGEPSDTAVDAAAEAMWRAEVAAFPAASYARSSAKWEEQADGVRAKWTDLARAALSVTRTPTPDPSGAEEMRTDWSQTHVPDNDLAQAIANKVLGPEGPYPHPEAYFAIWPEIASALLARPTRPTTGGTDGKSAEEMREAVARAIYDALYDDKFDRLPYDGAEREFFLRVGDAAAVALRTSRAATEARVGEWQPIETVDFDGTLKLFATRNGGVYIAPAVKAIKPTTAELRKVHERTGEWPNAGWIPWLWRELPAVPSFRADPPSIPTPPASEVKP